MNELDTNEEVNVKDPRPNEEVEPLNNPDPTELSEDRRGRYRDTPPTSKDFDFVYVGKSGKGSKHECRNHKDCRSSEQCVYSRSRGYRVCKRKSSGRTCKRSNECKKNERCSDAGYCIKDDGHKPTSGDRCNKRSDCGSNRSCSGGYCVRRDLDLEVMEEE